MKREQIDTINRLFASLWVPRIKQLLDINDERKELDKQFSLNIHNMNSTISPVFKLPASQKMDRKTLRLLVTNKVLTRERK